MTGRRRMGLRPAKGGSLRVAIAFAGGRVSLLLATLAFACGSGTRNVTPPPDGGPPADAGGSDAGPPAATLGCAVTTLLHQDSAGMPGMVVAVDDCDGGPIAGLTAADFTLTEDGSSETPTLAGSTRASPLVTLLFDLSPRGVEHIQEQIAGAKAFISRAQTAGGPAMRIALYTYSTGARDSAAPAPLYALPLDTAGLLAAVDTLSSAKAGSGRNLYGTVVSALRGLPGPSTNGGVADSTIVVLTAGNDDQGFYSEDTVEAFECVPGATACVPQGHGGSAQLCPSFNCGSGNYCTGTAEFCSSGFCAYGGSNGSYLCDPSGTTQCTGPQLPVGESYGFCSGTSTESFSCAAGANCCCTSDDCKRVFAASYCASPARVVAMVMPVPGLDLTQLRSIAPGGVLTPADASGAATMGGALADQVISSRRALYDVGYCSTLRASSHTATLGLAHAATQTKATLTFNADAFSAGCTPEGIAGTCTGHDCGQLCGDCDDRTSTCQASTCVSDCKAAKACGGKTITNPAGYPQTCADQPVSSTCGTTCVDLTSDAANCGACGTRCASGASCVGGACVCPGSEQACGSTCVDVSTSMGNCGACGNVCASGFLCKGGVCVCPNNELACGSTCINPATDASNCGGCGKVCAIGATCVSSSCQCPVGQTACSGSCIDEQSDVNNCGACGNRCAVGSACVTGACRASVALASAQAGPWPIVSDANAVYWANVSNGTVMKVPVGGGTPTNIASGQGVVLGLAIDSTNLYWSNGNGSVMSAPLAGGTATELASGQAGSGAIAVDASYVYWVNPAATPAIMRIAKSGGAPVVVVSGYKANGLAISNGMLYWTTNDKVIVYDVRTWPNDGSPVALATGQGQAYGIVVDANAVYWTNYGTRGAVRKVSLDGTNYVELASAQNQPFGIAVDSGAVYWADRAQPDGAVMKVPLAGGTPLALAVGQNAPFYVTVDASSVYWTDEGGGTVMKTAK